MVSIVARAVVDTTFRMVGLDTPPHSSNLYRDLKARIAQCVSDSFGLRWY